MAHQNKKCICCGEKYSYCPSCSRADALQPSWKSDFCSEPCMTLWKTLTKYSMELATKEEAKEIISALDLKSMETYAACVQRDYAKVMTEELKPKRSKRAEMSIIEEAIDPTIIETIHEVVTQENK